MSANGFIKLHRKMLDWEWYDDPNTKAVFLHLLLTANYRPTSYRGVALEPGQTVVGRKALAETLGMSEQNVRTAINHLKSTNEITIKSTNKFSVVTIVNWESYQCVDDESTNEVTDNLTNNQPTTNQQLTNNQPHHKNNKKDKKEKNIYKDVPSEIREPFMEWVAMREKLKRPIISETGVTRALNKLNALSKNPEKQKELIEYAIYKNWLSFYPIPEEDKIPKPKVEEKSKPIKAEPMPEDVKNKLAAMGMANVIGRGDAND